MFQLLKRAVKGIVWGPPRNSRAGPRSYINRPRRIDGAQYIQLGTNATVDRFSWLSAIDEYAGIKYHPEIVIGNDVHIGRYACLTAVQSIVIEEGCLLSEHIYITDLVHGMDPEGGLLVDQPLVSKGPVRICAFSFIGYRACILSGVTLGRHCVVGANSVVTQSFPNYSMVGGVPAKLLKTYSPALKQWIAVKQKETVHD